MYAKTICPYCKKPSVHSITARYCEVSSFTDWGCETQYVVENITIDETVAAEEFVRSVLRTIHGYLRDGIEVRELCGILRTCYGIAAAYCCDLIQQIKLELNMYSPDRRHLYFVTA